MDKQTLRNALSAVEDRARAIRKQANNDSGVREVASLVAQLTQLVREDIVQ